MPARDRPRALVIDDEESLRLLFSDFLSLRGYDVETAGTAVAGLAVARERPPSIILLDLNMPGVVSGAEAVAALARVAPVIVVSGTDDVELARDTLQQGAFDYVTKPFDLNHLATIMAAAITHRGGTPP